MIRINSEKCVIKQLCLCVNITEYTYTNPGFIAYYTPRLRGIAVATRLWTCIACYFMCLHITKWKKATRKEYLVLWPNCMTFQKRQNYGDSEKVSGSQGCPTHAEEPPWPSRAHLCPPGFTLSTLGMGRRGKGWIGRR